MPSTSPRTDELFLNTGPLWVDKFEDWNKLYPLTSNEPVSASSPWVGTALTSGTFAMTSAAAFGEAIQSGQATTDNSGSQVQDDVATYYLDLGRQIDFTCRVKQSDQTQSEIFAGIGVIDTTFLDGTGTLAAGLTHTDSIGFYKPDGEANWYGVVRVGSANIITVGPIAAQAASTYQILKFTVRMDPTVAQKGTVEFWVDGNGGGTVPSTGLMANTVAMARTWAFVTGDATGTKTCTCDYIGARMSR